LEIKGDCPHCKEKVKIDLEKMSMDKVTNSDLQNTTATSGAAQQVLEKPEPEIKEVIKVLAPKDSPYFECKDGNCGDGVHKNENYTKIPDEKCSNCGSLNGNKKCKNCGNTDPEEFEKQDTEELNELGIYSPTEHEHKHDQ